MSSADPGFRTALHEAQTGLEEGGIPIGACLVSAEGKILGQGHNQRVQRKSAILHAEIDALDRAGRLPARAYVGATMYTTLSPCDMCAGACLLYGIRRVVVGENKNFVGGEEQLRNRGVEVVMLQDEECIDLMKSFIQEKPELWNEDIGT